MYNSLIELEGQTFDRVVKKPRLGGRENTIDTILFERASGPSYALAHEQECCEDVQIEEIIGDLSDLEGTPILVAEERFEDFSGKTREGEEYEEDSATYSFYTFRTIKGTVTVRFFGSSNGYYSERVSLRRISNDKEDF